MSQINILEGRLELIEMALSSAQNRCAAGDNYSFNSQRVQRLERKMAEALESLKNLTMLAALQEKYGEDVEILRVLADQGNARVELVGGVVVEGCFDVFGYFEITG